MAFGVEHECGGEAFERDGATCAGLNGAIDGTLASASEFGEEGVWSEEAEGRRRIDGASGEFKPGVKDIAEAEECIKSRIDGLLRMCFGLGMIRPVGVHGRPSS
jgi:hypothetical protein